MSPTQQNVISQWLFDASGAAWSSAALPLRSALALPWLRGVAVAEFCCTPSKTPQSLTSQEQASLGGF